MGDEIKVTKGVVNKIKAQFAAHPIKTATALIAVPSALIALVMQGFALYDKVESYVEKNIVTPRQLKESELRITAKVHNEAVIIREVFIAGLIEEKTKLNELIRKSTTTGQIKYYTIQIDALNKKIDKLRGNTQ